MLQNWEHSAFRFFRHLCAEDYRNAINHSGLKFATLEFYQNLTFEWISVNEITWQWRTIYLVRRSNGVKTGDINDCGQAFQHI